MSKDRCVVWDIDDSMLDFRGAVKTIHEELKGVTYTDKDLTEWDFPNDLYQTFLENESAVYLSSKPKPGVVAKAKEFRHRGYKIILMTARPEAFKTETRINLAMNGIVYDELLFNKNKSLKINRISDQYEIRVFADDKLDTVEKVKRDTDVPHVYLVQAPWNKDSEVSEGIKRIKSISEIE